MNSKPNIHQADDASAREPHPEDTVSDPANNDELGQDWTSEGGAMQEGPATKQEKPSAKDQDTPEEPSATG